MNKLSTIMGVLALATTASLQAAPLEQPGVILGGTTLSNFNVSFDGDITQAAIQNVQHDINASINADSPQAQQDSLTTNTSGIVEVESGGATAVGAYVSGTPQTVAESQGAGVQLTAGNAATETVTRIDYLAEGNGVMTISLDASLYTNIDAGMFNNENVFVRNSVSLSHNGDADSQVTESSFYDSTAGDFTSEDIKSLSYDVAVTGRSLGYFTINTQTSADSGVAAVPVPAAVWLLGSGFASILLVRRKRKVS